MKDDQHHESVSEIRLNEGLREALGPNIQALLEEESVTDVLANADGRVWVSRTGKGREFSGIRLSSDDAGFALRMLASHAGIVLTREKPLLSATLPVTGERIAGTIAPITAGPTFAIRVPPRKTFDVEDFPRVRRPGAGFIDISDQLFTLMDEGRNVLIAGATGSGKTSYLSALLKLSIVRQDRCLVIEDTQEIAIEAPDQVRFLSSPEVSIEQLVQHSLRYKPDRIIIGEVRNGWAGLEMVKAMNTGHSGSFATIHANSARDALLKLESLLSQVGHVAPHRDVAAAIGCVVFMWRCQITEIIAVDGWDASTGYVTREI